jgi:hypothetical protein
MKFRQANEGFEWVFKVEEKEIQIARLKQWASTNQTVVPMVRMGVGAETRDWKLPSGTPETLKLDADIPDGMGDTTIQMEWRRISAFTDPNHNMQKLPEWKREMNWLQILEGLHYKEANVLTAIKDGVLLTVYPQLEALLPDLGITEWNKTTTKAKKKAPAKKAKAKNVA